MEFRKQPAYDLKTETKFNAQSAVETTVNTIFFRRDTRASQHKRKPDIDTIESYMKVKESL